MGIIAATVPRLAELRATLFRQSQNLFGIKEIVVASRAGGLLRPAAEKLALQRTDLSPGVIEFFGQPLDAFHGSGMLALPITHLPPKFGTQLLQLPFQTLDGVAAFAGKRSFRYLGRNVQKHGIHEAMLYPNQRI